MKVPALDGQAAKQRGEVFQVAGDEVADFALTLPGAVYRHEA